MQGSFGFHIITQRSLHILPECLYYQHAQGTRTYIGLTPLSLMQGHSPSPAFSPRTPQSNALAYCTAGTRTLGHKSKARTAVQRNHLTFKTKKRQQITPQRIVLAYSTASAHAAATGAVGYKSKAHPARRNQVTFKNKQKACPEVTPKHNVSGYFAASASSTATRAVTYKSNARTVGQNQLIFKTKPT